MKVELGAFEGIGVRELLKPSLAVAGKSTAISASVFAVKSPFISSFYTTSPALRSAFTSLSNAVRSSGLVSVSKSVSKGVSKSVASSVVSVSPSTSVSRSTSVGKSLVSKSTSPLTSISSSVSSAFTSTSSVISQMSKGSVSKSQLSKFSQSASKVRSMSMSSFTFLSKAASYPKPKRRKKEEFEFRKILEEGVASKFLKITPITSPEELLKGVLRR